MFPSFHFISFHFISSAETFIHWHELHASVGHIILFTNWPIINKNISSEPTELFRLFRHSAATIKQINNNKSFLNSQMTMATATTITATTTAAAITTILQATKRSSYNLQHGERCKVQIPRDLLCLPVCVWCVCLCVLCVYLLRKCCSLFTRKLF